MKKQFKRCMAFLMACTLGVGMLYGCTTADRQEDTKAEIETMEPEQSAAVSFNILGGKDVMPIGGFYGPFNTKGSYDGNAVPNYLTEEYFQKISEAGVNLIVQAYISGDDNIQLALDLGEKYGIGWMVPDAILSSPAIAGQKSDVELAEILTKWRNHPAYCGIHVCDEPGSLSYYSQGGNGGMMEDYEELCSRLSNNLDTLYYMNLIRCYTDGAKAGYELYLKQFCENCGGQVLSYDFYPFEWDTRGTESLYFWNLAVVREYAQKYHIPFWAFVQAGGNWDTTRDIEEDWENYHPSEGQFRWNVNTCLAFGAQGIEYFPLIQPSEFASYPDGSWNFETNALLGMVGNKNRWWYYAQNINKHIAAIDEVLMNSVNKGVLAVGAAKDDCGDTRDALISGNSWRELASVDGDALVGCFNYQGKTALYVVNYDTEYAQKINLEFQDLYRVKIIQNAEERYVKTDSLPLDMTAGEGVLLVFE